MNKFTSSVSVKRIAESTVRRLSIYLSFLEEIEAEGVLTTSSDDLAKLGGTTSAQVRKDLSFFGSFGKRGTRLLGARACCRLRDILGLGKQWRVCIVGAGKIGAALARYAGFAERGFMVTGTLRCRSIQDRTPFGRSDRSRIPMSSRKTSRPGSTTSR